MVLIAHLHVNINNSMCVVQGMQQREHKETGESFRLSSFC